jgi:flagellar biosynthetic protein FliQ
MTPELPNALLRQGLLELGITGAPIMGALMLVGLVVGVLQAATQVNDPAVGFLPRFVTGGAVLLGLGNWMLHRMSQLLQLALSDMANRGF